MDLNERILVIDNQSIVSRQIVRLLQTKFKDNEVVLVQENDKRLQENYSVEKQTIIVHPPTYEELKFYPDHLKRVSQKTSFTWKSQSKKKSKSKQ